LAVYHENIPHIGNRYFFSVIFAFLWKYYIQQWRQREPLPWIPLLQVGLSFSELAAPTAAIEEKKYFHKNAKITEKKYLLSR